MSQEVCCLTPQGWAAVASLHLGLKFPDLERHDPEIQAILAPLFEKAQRRALDHYIESFPPLPLEQEHENPSTGG